MEQNQKIIVSEAIGKDKGMPKCQCSDVLGRLLFL